ncbi:hypothetical protein [Sinomonas albida]|uniref:hypothetical protein n=1 Tax=Sinomonas albida TaxID=369942 RepID=UPI0030178173
MLLNAAAERWLSASDVLALVMGSAGPRSYGASRERALDAVKALVLSGKLVPGTARNGQHVPWNLSRTEAVRKIESEWNTSAATSTWFAAAPAMAAETLNAQQASPGLATGASQGLPAPADNTDQWVQISKDTRLRAVALDAESPRWEGSWLRTRLWLKRATAITLLALATAWLCWAIIAGFAHRLASYTKTEAIVTSQTDTSDRASQCSVDLDYIVNSQQLHGVAKINANCSTLPGPGARAVLDVNASDPNDIWIDGASDANHPDPAFFLVMLIIGVPSMVIALLNWLTDYNGIRRLLSSGATWHQVQATVVRRDGGRNGVTVRLEAEDLTGAMRPFLLHYYVRSPIGPVRKGDKVTITLIANGRWQALTRRSDPERLWVAHIN